MDENVSYFTGAKTLWADTNPIPYIVGCQSNWDCFIHREDHAYNINKHVVTSRLLHTSSYNVSYVRLGILDVFKRHNILLAKSLSICERPLSLLKHHSLNVHTIGYNSLIVSEIIDPILTRFFTKIKLKYSCNNKQKNYQFHFYTSSTNYN